MKTLKMTLLSFAALAFFLFPADAFAGPSKYRVRVKAYRPMVQIDQSQRIHMRIQQDRQRARRLAAYTRYSARRFLEYRARGWSWSKIGRRFDVPRKVMRASRSTESWRKFLRPRHWCGTRSH